MRLAQPGDWPAIVTPKGAEAPSSPVERWRAAVGSAGARLAPIGDGLRLVDATGRIGELTPDGFAPPERLLPPGGWRSAYASPPIYVTDAGVVGRWSGDGSLTSTWSTGLPGSRVDAFGLPGGSVLASSSAWEAGLRLVDERSGVPAWTLGLTLPRCLAVDGLALGVVRNRLIAVDLGEGSVRWSEPSVDRLAAIAGDTAWALRSGEAIGLDLRDGRVRTRQPLAMSAPRPILDGRGRLHVVGGTFSVAILDILDGGRLLALWTHQHAGPSPQPLAVTADGSLLLAAGGALMRCTAEVFEELWHGDGIIGDAQVHDRHVFVLEEMPGEDSVLYCLG